MVLFLFLFVCGSECKLKKSTEITPKKCLLANMQKIFYFWFFVLFLFSLFWFLFGTPPLKKALVLQFRGFSSFVPLIALSLKSLSAYFGLFSLFSCCFPFQDSSFGSIYPLLFFFGGGLFCPFWGPRPLSWLFFLFETNIPNIPLFKPHLLSLLVVFVCFCCFLFGMLFFCHCFVFVLFLGLLSDSETNMVFSAILVSFGLCCVKGSSFYVFCFCSIFSCVACFQSKQ